MRPTQRVLMQLSYALAAALPLAACASSGASPVDSDDGNVMVDPDRDSDGDGIPDVIDDDDDNDGIPDDMEVGSTGGDSGGSNGASNGTSNGFDGDVPPGDASPAIEIGENNLFPSPMPPGGLSVENTPQIIVFGWDDMAFTGDFGTDTAQPDNAMNFLQQTWGSLKNPDGSDAHISFYQNGAYLPNTEPGGPWGGETNLMLQAGKDLVAEGFEVGNHTFDHLETNGTWGKIPPAFKTGALGGWAEAAGRQLDAATWKNPVMMVNDSILRSSYGVGQLFGFRAPRLEMNGAGLNALAEIGYLYDCSMEEGIDWEHVTAAVMPGADQKGFKWVVWPHTFDNGSPGAWQSQDFGEKQYLDSFPKGLWEVPVYMLYIPDNGLQETIATRMKTEITTEDVSWVGDKVREITAFDFNTFLYARMRKEEWVEVMKYNFLLRYNGNRAPMTFGAHPGEFSSRYDNEVLRGQANNADFVDVLSYNTFQDRKDAVKEFVDWVKATYPNDAYFMSGKELIDFMKRPFDKSGNPVTAEALASPANDNLLQLASEWTVNQDELGSSASVFVEDGNTMSVDFKVANDDEANARYAYVSTSSYFTKGALSGVSHFDILYESASPFRVRLVPEDPNAVAMQVLLAGTGERAARVRIKDFRPDNYTEAAKIADAGFVDAAYLANVVGISIEAAPATGARDFKVDIKRIVAHGLVGGSEKSRTGAASAPSLNAARLNAASRRAPGAGLGSAAHWPSHLEHHAH